MTIRARLEAVAASAWFAYGSLLAIQAKVLWGIWDHRDLTSGDTTQYFIRASEWSDSLSLDPLWSPMYTGYWGSLKWIVGDPYAVTILHRVLIAVACALLLLAVLRRLLTPGIAWALAVWWAVLPVGYDALYEVHLFALVPELVAVLIASRWSGTWMRSAVFGVLLATALLMRNEVLVAAGLWLLVWAAFELSERRRGRATEPALLARAVGVPIVIVSVLFAATALSEGHLSDFRARSESKHEVNVCQIYAFGYQQRHDDFTGSPWLDCQQLMRRDFGEPLPSFTEAFRENPSAMAEHVGWNLRLSPYTFQLLLFNRMSADRRHNPDYAEVTTGSVAARFGLLAVAAFIVGGLILLWRDRRRWWTDWIAERAWGWAALLALGVSAASVIVWQRPRPSYLFALGVLMFAVIGMCAMAYADRWPWLRRLSAAPPLLAVGLVVAIPPHFTSGYQTQQIGRPDRPLKAMVDRLLLQDDELRGSDVRLLGTYSAAACPYIGGEDPCTALDWGSVTSRPPGTQAEQVLDSEDVDFIYADATDLRDPGMSSAIREARAAGWTVVDSGSGEDRWLLLARPSTSPVT